LRHDITKRGRAQRADNIGHVGRVMCGIGERLVDSFERSSRKIDL